MANICAELHEALVEAGCLISGVSMGRMDDRKTWVIRWCGTPTKDQVAAAQAILDTFDATPRKEPPSIPQIMAALVAALIASGALKADELPVEVQALMDWSKRQS